MHPIGGNTMDKKKLEHYKKLLLKEKEELVSTLELMNENEPNSSLMEYYDELSSYDNHPADTGSETFQMEMNFNLKNNEIVHIQEVDEALKRIKDGNYGQCISCGKDIDEDRLEILPTTLECMDCENKETPLDVTMKTRPVEEELIGPPFGRTFKDSDEAYNGFDGEDSWQSVARYNKTEEDQKALDWYDNNMYDKNASGISQEVDKYSQGYYTGQLENGYRKDIPRKQRRKKH